MISEVNKDINRRKEVLIVDDEEVNRILLGAILGPDYNIFYATNGAEALEIIRERVDTLSLVLMDLIMPVMDGMELLNILRQEIELSKLPVVVLTSEFEYEIKCLQMGAMDFIRKPFELPEIVEARINRVIELTEDRRILEATEHDATGLYTKNFFLEYTQQIDTYKGDAQMDTIALSVDHFSMINEIYGHETGDVILKETGTKIAEFVKEHHGIGCHWDGSQFYIYCRHVENRKEIEQLCYAMADFDEKLRIRLRAGIYNESDNQISVEKRLTASRFACNTLKNNQTSCLAYYDSSLHENELLMERLLSDTQRGIDEHQFKVFFQPKLDIRGDKPVLHSAEALVRWQHPELGLLSPGRFVPLFEENGMMQALDREVWSETVKLMSHWQEDLSIPVTVSVNVSRMDLYDESNIDYLETLLKENNIPKERLHLEITESAYTDNQNIVNGVIDRMKAEGFHIEMDDFGSGYSSLDALTKMPIDTLKLDMIFARGVEKDDKKCRLVELILDFAKYLDVQTVAEGIEEESQYRIMKEAGCDVLQGYYFSKPLPSDEFEEYLIREVRK